MVYSRHARQEILADMSKLRFPNEAIIDPLQLALSKEVRYSLDYSRKQAKAHAKKAGMTDVLFGHSVHLYGYGDRHFTAEFASGLGREVSDFLQAKEVITNPFSLRDYAKLFQTGWFGDMLNQCAITGIGMLQPYYDHHGRRLFKNGFLKPAKPKDNAQQNNAADYEPYATEIDPDSSLAIVRLTKEAKMILRANMSKPIGVGCPVARTAIKATRAQVDFLESEDHMELSGFWADERQMATEGMVKLCQGPYTAIDDVAWQWGDYVDRYARSLLATGHNQEGIELTAASRSVLLD